MDRNSFFPLLDMIFLPDLWRDVLLEGSHDFGWRELMTSRVPFYLVRKRRVPNPLLFCLTLLLPFPSFPAKKCTQILKKRSLQKIILFFSKIDHAQTWPKGQKRLSAFGKTICMRPYCSESFTDTFYNLISAPLFAVWFKWLPWVVNI